MRIKKIKIKNFMSFKDFAWENIDSKLNLIVGPNGSGKTNFFNAFRIFSESLNDRNSSELLDEIKNFAHLGNRNEKIKISMSVEFENEEKNIILAFVWASLFNTLSNRPMQFDSVDEGMLRGFLTVDDIADFFKGDLIGEYDFYSNRWDVRYESETFQCLVDGGYPSYMLASENDGGLIVKLREKFTEFIKTNFKETQNQQSYVEQITTNIQIKGKTSTALNLSIHPNQNNLKPLTIFRNLIGDTNTSKSYNLRSLFGCFLNHAIIFNENFRELPKTNFSSKEIEDEQNNDSINSKNIAFVLHGLKNGNLVNREKFSRIKRNFEELTEGLQFDITAKYISNPVLTGRHHDFNEDAGIPGQEIVLDGKRDISISLYLQVIKDGHEFPLRYSGAGTWEALYFSCLMESKGNIFLLDEPVANVHPNRQKLFSRKFQRNSSSQLFISTHSPYLTGLEDFQKISRFDFDGEKKTTVRHFCSGPIESKVLEILSRSKTATSSLFSRAAILVEGATELAAIPKWFSEYFQSSLEDKNIVLINVGGKESFKHYLKLLKSFDVPWAILCDGDAIGSTSDTCEIGDQLGKIGVKFNTELKTLNFQDRKSILNNYQVFTTAETETKDFESMSVFKTAVTTGKSKPGIALELALSEPCPDELKTYFFDLVKVLPRWSNILS